MSGETKFTAGPWRIEPPHNHEGGDGFSILREDLHEVEWVAEVGWEADAYLIAASPELYAALEEAPLLSKYHSANGFEVERFVADYADWMGRNRNVRGKARGESQ